MFVIKTDKKLHPYETFFKHMILFKSSTKSLKETSLSNNKHHSSDLKTWSY